MASQDAAITGPKLLIADDNTVNQTVALRMVEKLGYCADAVSSGGDAISALEREAYDVVLMDMQMPHMSGIEAAKKIRARWGAAELRIIALTASDLEEDRRQCREAGMDDFLTKPIQSDRLKEAIERHMGPTPDAAAASDGACVRLQAQLEEFTAMFGEETAIELFTLFLTDTPPRLELLEHAITERDHEETRRLAHALKGGCASLGIDAMAESCAALETEAKAGDLSHAADHFVAVGREFENVQAFARRLEAGHRAGITG